MQRATERDRRVRLEGGANLEKAALDAGVRRYIVQSSAFFLAPGPGLADESTPLAVDASPAIAANARLYTEIERRALTGGIPESVVLRYGFFYGPGTWYTPDGSLTERVQRQQYPIAGDGHGVWSFIHVEDAATATVAALECAPGVYNIVDDQPSELYIWLPAFARWVGAPSPPRISAEEALRTFGPDYLYNATRLRGASNTKARSELGFQPRPLEWLAITT